MPRPYNSGKKDERGCAVREGSRNRGSGSKKRGSGSKKRRSRSKSHSHSKSHKKKKRKNRSSSSSRSRSRSPEVRAFGSETLSFAGGGINANQCQKKYLNVNSPAIFAAALANAKKDKPDESTADQEKDAENINTNEANKYTNNKRACEVCAIAALCTRSLVITWAIEPDDKDKNNKENGFKDVSTIYTIIIERVQGCKGEPILKFQVPCTQVDVDECPPACTSQLLGTSKAFKVDVAAGTLLRAAVIQTLLDPCKKKPCEPPDEDKPEPKATGIEAIVVDLYLF